jgi:hypothetical protein
VRLDGVWRSARLSVEDFIARLGAMSDLAVDDPSEEFNEELAAVEADEP